MKNKELKHLKLNKKAISNFNTNHLKGGSITSIYSWVVCIPDTTSVTEQ